MGRAGVTLPSARRTGDARAGAESTDDDEAASRRPFVSHYSSPRAGRSGDAGRRRRRRPAARRSHASSSAGCDAAVSISSFVRSRSTRSLASSSFRGRSVASPSPATPLALWAQPGGIRAGGCSPLRAPLALRESVAGDALHGLAQRRVALEPVRVPPRQARRAARRSAQPGDPLDDFARGAPSGRGVIARMKSRDLLRRDFGAHFVQLERARFDAADERDVVARRFRRASSYSSRAATA